MTLNQAIESLLLVPMMCPRCGAPIRLIGCEPHPVRDGTELFTFVCTSCDTFQVLPFHGPQQGKRNAGH